MFKPVSKLSRAELQRLIRTLSATSERIVWTLHAERQMKRRKITKQIALEVLRHGSIRQPPEPNPAKGSIECRMEWYVAGIDCTVVAALQAELVGTDPELLVIVVTAWD